MFVITVSLSTVVVNVETTCAKANWFAWIENIHVTKGDFEVCDGAIVRVLLLLLIVHSPLIDWNTPFVTLNQSTE